MAGRLRYETEEGKAAQLASWRDYSARQRKEHPKRWSDQRYATYRAHLDRALYGIEPDEYQRMFIAQDGVCAICGGASRYKRRDGTPTNRLAVDHDHETGRIRGLLCDRCNRSIGNIEALGLASKMFEYLGFAKARKDTP